MRTHVQPVRRHSAIPISEPFRAEAAEAGGKLINSLQRSSKTNSSSPPFRQHIFWTAVEGQNEHIVPTMYFFMLASNLQPCLDTE